MNDHQAEARITVFFDGSCPLCRREIGFYRNCRGADRLTWVDVSQQAGIAALPEGLDCVAAMQRFHVQSADGRLSSGGEAFAVLWHALPSFRLAGWLFRLWPFSALLELAYRLFLPLRPGLQRYFARKG